MINNILKIFPAFSERNYRYYFVGQLVSQIGTWLQIVAQGWLVLTLTKSLLLIGIVSATLTLPLLIFGVFGGVIVDRFDKKKLIMLTNSGSMLVAFILGVLTVSGDIQIWQIMILSFLLGTINAVDMPARQAFVSEMVSKDKLPSAIAMNASIFNAARVVGPAVAGLLIALIGVGGAFLLNSATYIAAILVQFLVVPMYHPKPKHSHPILAVKEGIVYTWTHPIVRSLIGLTAIVSIFGWSYTTIMPFIAENIFHQDATGLGYLYASAGLGAFSATILISALSSKFSPFFFIVGGNILFAVSMFLFSYTSVLYLGYLLLFIGGFGLLMVFPIINAQIQSRVEPHFRGRVMSIYLLMFVGLFPIGSFQFGFVSEYLGVQIAIRIGSVIVLTAAIIGIIFRGKVSQANKKFLSKKQIENA